MISFQSLVHSVLIFCLLLIYLGVFAHIADRDWECNADVKAAKCDDKDVDDIAEQLVHGDVGKHLKVIFGGGRYNFIDVSTQDEQGNPGKRTDGKNLINEWINNRKPNEKRSYVWNKVSKTVFFYSKIRRLSFPSLFRLKRVFFISPFIYRMVYYRFNRL